MVASTGRWCGFAISGAGWPQDSKECARKSRGNLHITRFGDDFEESGGSLVGRGSCRCILQLCLQRKQCFLLDLGEVIRKITEKRQKALPAFNRPPLGAVMDQNNRRIIDMDVAEMVCGGHVCSW